MTASDGVEGFAINPADGSLKSLLGSPFASSIQPTVLEASPSGSMALGISGHTVWVLRIDNRGAMQADPTPTLQFPSSDAFISVHFSPVAFGASGKTVYLANYVGPSILSAHAFDEKAGTIAPAASSQVQFPYQPCSDPTFCGDNGVMTVAGYSNGAAGEYVWADWFICPFHMDCVEELFPMRISSAGAIGPIPVGSSGPITTYNDTSTFLAWSIFSDGAVTAEQVACCGSPFLGSYALQNGNIVAMQGCVFWEPGCPNVASIVMHPNHKLAIIGNSDGRLSTATRDAGGNLSLPVASSVSIGVAADQLVLDQDGKYLYVMPSTANQVFGFSIDANTGVLQAIPGSPWSVGSSTFSVGTRSFFTVRLTVPQQQQF